MSLTCEANWVAALVLMPCFGHHAVQARLREVEQERGELLNQQHLLEEKLEASKLQVCSSGVLCRVALPRKP